jgi:hypothetical protein
MGLVAKKFSTREAGHLTIVEGGCDLDAMGLRRSLGWPRCLSHNAGFGLRNAIEF